MGDSVAIELYRKTISVMGHIGLTLLGVLLVKVTYILGLGELYLIGFISQYQVNCISSVAILVNLEQ